ncbi:MaoC/PaaZ C-terminal domain-containing protein [Streptomyces sp. NPDC050504]|uniref:MaoC/PaaZ C-terminal domain-containing protein n=1 Tax=Streptomyces sp. NPDC050504 TaxID=3365618 RepID=UPI0037AC3E29
MSTTLTLLRAALASPLKRPGATPRLPGSRLHLPAARIDPAHLAAYAEVCRFPAPGTGPGTGPRPRPLPLPYPHVLAFPLAMRLMAARAFPLPVLGLVHTGIGITRHHALLPDDRPDLTVYARELRPHRRGTEVVVVTEARLAGDLAWESHSTYLARHDRGTAPERARTATAPKPAGPVPALPVLARWHLPGDLGRRYGRASGDFNPIHLHPLTARALGFPRAIAHGMWTLARCLAEHGEGDPTRVRAEFKAPVPLPSTVAYAADEDTGAFELRSPDGKLHLTGHIRSTGP